MTHVERVDVTGHRDPDGQIRAGEGPRFIECQTYRFRAHSMFDAQLYRDKAEVEAWKQKGPVLRFGHWLEEAGMLDAAGRARIDAEIEEELKAAVDCVGHEADDDGEYK